MDLLFPPLLGGRRRIEFTHDPHLPHHQLLIQQIILCNFHHLQWNSIAGHLFSFPALSAFCRDHSLHNIHVYFAIHTNHPLSNSSSCYNHRHCNTCPVTSPIPPFEDPNSLSSYTSSSLVSCIQCSQCAFLYIEETNTDWVSISLHTCIQSLLATLIPHETSTLIYQPLASFTVTASSIRSWGAAP